MITNSAGIDAHRHAGWRAERRGAMLLEVVVAIAVFVAASLAVLAAVQRAAAAAVLARDQIHAVDLARSAIAKIESGIARAEALNGPVPAWGEGAIGEGNSSASGIGPGAGTGFRDVPKRASGWELEIRTEPTSFEGLTAVTVEARRRRVEGSDSVSASFRLTQFVRMVRSGGSAPEGASGSASHGVQRTPRGPDRGATRPRSEAL